MIPTVKIVIPKKLRILDPDAAGIYERVLGQIVKNDLPPIAVNAARSETPVASGGLSVSVRPTIVGNGVVPTAIRIEWTSPYARAVEDGTQPHFVPIGALIRWVGIVLQGGKEVAYRIQTSISKKGTRPKRYLAPARSAIYKAVVPVFRRRAALISNFLQGRL